MELTVDIEKRLGNFHLRANFTVQMETFALLGASGCGKSMTLKCIAGIERPDRGSIILDGQTLFDREKHINLPLQKRKVGYLFQQYALFPNMSAEQNIRCALPKQMTREEKKRQLEDLVRRFRLEGLERKLPSQLSGGQQQRVALARILASSPKAILLDEPFSALDGFLKWNLEAELGALLSGFDGPIVWVSHDLGECCRNCGRVCVMENGASGEVRALGDLIARPRTLSEVKLVGHRNFVRAQAEPGGLYLPEWKLHLRGAFALEQEGTLCIPSSAMDMEGAALSFRVQKVIRDVDHTVALLLPDGAMEDAPALRAIYALDGAPKTGDTVSFSLLQERLLLL